MNYNTLLLFFIAMFSSSALAQTAETTITLCQTNPGGTYYTELDFGVDLSSYSISESDSSQVAMYWDTGLGSYQPWGWARCKWDSAGELGSVVYTLDSTNWPTSWPDLYCGTTYDGSYYDVVIYQQNTLKCGATTKGFNYTNPMDPLTLSRRPGKASSVIGRHALPLGEVDYGWETWIQAKKNDHSDWDGVMCIAKKRQFSSGTYSGLYFAEVFAFATSEADTGYGGCHVDAYNSSGNPIAPFFIPIKVEDDD